MTGVAALQATPVGPGGDVSIVGSLLTLIPRLVVAAVLLLVGYVLGQRLGDAGTTLVERIDLPAALMETPLGAVFESRAEVEATVERLVFYFVVLVALSAAVSLVGFNQVFRVIFEGAQYLPSVVGGVVVVFVGFVVAGYVARNVKESTVFGDAPYTPLLATVAKLVVYFVAITLGLDALGYSTAILTTLAQAVAIGLGLGIALAFGIAVGLGSQDYVAERIEEWVES